MARIGRTKSCARMTRWRGKAELEATHPPGNLAAAALASARCELLHHPWVALHFLNRALLPSALLDVCGTEGPSKFGLSEPATGQTQSHIGAKGVLNLSGHRYAWIWHYHQSFYRRWVRRWGGQYFTRAPFWGASAVARALINLSSKRVCETSRHVADCLGFAPRAHGWAPGLQTTPALGPSAKNPGSKRRAGGPWSSALESSPSGPSRRALAPRSGLGPWPQALGPQGLGGPRI